MKIVITKQNVCDGIGNIEEELCSTCFGLGKKAEECTKIFLIKV